jgi:hypothetical protein
MADTKKYKVVTPIGMNGKDYAPGKIIELTDAEAEAMPWAVELPKAPVAPAEQEPQKTEMTEAHALFLMEKGYAVDSVEKAQAFFDKLGSKEQASFLADFAKSTEKK